MPFRRIGSWPLFAKDVDTDNATALKCKNGALQVDLAELEDVQINLPDGTTLAVEVQNPAAIPVSLPEGDVGVQINNTGAVGVEIQNAGNIGVEINNAAAVPVDLPAERVVDVKAPTGVNIPVTIENVAAVPVSLPEEDLGVQINNTGALDVEVVNESPIAVEFDAVPEVTAGHKMPSSQSVQILSGASTSATIDVGGIEAFGIGVPYGTEGVYIGLLVSADDTNWFVLSDRMGFVADVSGTNYAVNPASIDLMTILAPWRYCKLVTLDSEGAEQNQTADRTLTVVMR